MEEGAKLTQPGPSCRGVGDRGCDPREAVVPKLGPGLLLSIPSLIVFPFPSRVLPCLFGCCISPQRHCLSPRVFMHVECPGQSACTSPDLRTVGSLVAAESLRTSVGRDRGSCNPCPPGVIRRGSKLDSLLPAEP